MTSEQASEKNIEQYNKQTNVQVSEKTTTQLIKLLIAMIPYYDDVLCNAETELVLARSEHF